MLEQVAAAFECQDYHTAAKLLQQLRQESPEDPLVQLYSGTLHEVTGELEAATSIYQQLLRSHANRKIVAQARQGLERLEVLAVEQRKQAIAQATADPSDTQLGMLVLELLNNQKKTVAAQKLAQIMQLDAYTARLQLPSRGWRLYRTGAIGELRYLGQELLNSGIPCFWTTVAAIQKIRVFQVNYLQATTPEAKVICQNEQGQRGTLTFNWSEVAQRLVGQLPIFEQVVDFNHRGQLQRKTKTQDYAQFCDLHLPGRSCLLRLSDRTYQFQQGIAIAPPSAHTSNQATTRINWNGLLELLNQQLPQTNVWQDFTPFAETVLDQTELLSQIAAHVHLLRRTETNWDPAFHLYSGLIFNRCQINPSS